MFTKTLTFGRVIGRGNLEDDVVPSLGTVPQ